MNRFLLHKNKYWERPLYHSCKIKKILYPTKEERKLHKNYKSQDEIQYVDGYKFIRVHIYNSNTLLIFLTVVVDNDKRLHKLSNEIIRISEIGNIAC